MFRAYIPLAIALLFIVWALYRLFIKKDLRNHLNSLGLGFFFMGIWAVIYCWVL